MKSNRRHSYIPELDGIRGIAISCVFFFHCLPSIYLNDMDVTFFRHSLWIGVDLFFVLSGFLITRILIQTKDNPGKYVVFFSNRIVRIFPLYYFSLTLMYFILTVYPPVQSALNDTAPKEWYYTYTYNIYITMTGWWAKGDYLNHFWSLCIEEQFYLFWPFLIYGFSRKKLPYVIATVAIASCLLKVLFFLMDFSKAAIYTNTLTRMDSLALGGLAAYAHAFWQRDEIEPNCKGIFWFSALFLVIFSLFRSGIPIYSFVTQIIVTPVLSVCFASLIYLSVNGNGIFEHFRVILRTSALRFLGKYSYGIYIYHWLVWVTVIRLNVFGLETGDPFGNFFLTAAITLAVSVASFHLLESPFLRLKRKLR